MYFVIMSKKQFWSWSWIHRSPVNSLHKGQWRGALVFCLICAWTNGWVNNRDAGDLRRHRAHYDIMTVVVFLKYIKKHPFHQMDFWLIWCTYAIGTYFRTQSRPWSAVSNPCVRIKLCSIFYQTGTIQWGTASVAKISSAAVMRCCLLVGIAIGLWAYVIVGGFIFTALESSHEDETINGTLDVYLDLLREYINYHKWIKMHIDISKVTWVNDNIR